MNDDLARLREAWLDLCFAVFTASGLVWLCRRVGLELKPWVTDRLSDEPNPKN